MTESNLESQQSKSSKGKKRKSTLPRTLREALREGYRANEEKMTFESRVRLEMMEPFKATTRMREFAGTEMVLPLIVGDAAELA